MSTAVHADVNRRDFLFIATGAVATVGAALTAWPFISQMNPDASVLALATIEVDLAPIAEGQEITLKWRGNPVFVRHRTAKEIELAKAVKLEELKDPIARSANVNDGEPATDENRVVGGKETFLVMMGVCTHLGCVPFGNQGDYGVVEGNTTSGRLVLSLPWFALRYGGPHPQRSGAGESFRAKICVSLRHKNSHRLIGGKINEWSVKLSTEERLWQMDA